MGLRLVSLFTAVSVSLAAGDMGTARSAASKTIRLIEATNAKWTVGCMSCHNQAAPMMALGAARGRGLPVDEAAAKVHAAKTFGPAYGDLDSVAQGLEVIDAPFAESYALLGAAEGGIRNVATAASVLRIANWQLPDGHWATFDGRPPSAGSYFSTTAFAVRAIDLHLPAELQQQRVAIKAKARGWLLAAQPRLVEDRAFQLLGLAWSGATVEERRPLAAALLKLQRPDGGWGQLPGLESDAYTTSQSLVALTQAGGIRTSDAAWQRGLDWLLKAQAADGSWHVKSWINTPAKVSPPYFESGFPYGHDQFISMAAAAWAVMAIAESLPNTDSPARPLPVPEASPKVDAQWVHTALFGTAGDLGRAIDGGLDPNTATAGGTSLLMMAAHDEAKVRLLLSRGAKADYRTKAGITVPMVASTYRGSAGVLTLLLDQGASVKPAKGVKFNFSPLVMTALSGDVDAAKVLLDHGAAPSPVMVLGGFVPMMPLAAAQYCEHIDMIRLLVSRGVAVDEVDPDGMTALASAMLAQKPASARVLLELGAKPEHVDPTGWQARQHVLGIQYAPQELLRLAGSVERPAAKPKGD